MTSFSVFDELLVLTQTMRIWLSKNSEVPIHEQLVTQIILGIVSSDWKVKQRLPSTRDLARSYQIHANTVSAAYRELARRGWVEFRKGSGVYVSASVVERMSGQKRPPEDALVAVVSRWPEFLRWSRTMLLAAGIDGDAIPATEREQ